MALLNAHYVFPALPISHSSAELQGAVATIRVSLNRQHPSPIVREGIPNATGPPMPTVRRFGHAQRLGKQETMDD